jgi:alpha-D-xyloside xylohydrolase
VIRVAHIPVAGNFTAVNARVSLIAERDWEPVTPYVTSAGGFTSIKTKNLVVKIDEKTGQVHFQDLEGKTLIDEIAQHFTPTNDMGNPTYSIEQQWSSIDDESIFGGGEFQNGFLDFNNIPIQMVQFNTEAVVPFYVSSQGYGLLWDNYAWSHLNAKQSTQIQFTLTHNTNSNDDALPKGTSIIAKTCQAKDTPSMRQFWKYDEGDKRFHSQNEGTSDMVMDYDHNAKALHLWVKDTNFNYNQEWVFNGTLLQSTDSSPLCLEAIAGSANTGSSRITANSCDSSNANQQWKFTDIGQIQLKSGSELCITVDAGSISSYTFTANISGTYGFYVDSCNDFGCGMGKTMSLNISEGNDTTKLIDWQQLTNLPDAMAARVTLTAGKSYTLTFHTDASPTATVNMTTPEKRATTLSSNIGDLIDYYFTFESSGNIDGAIRGYRAVTGAAPLYARWAYGFWQCKEHYDTQEHLLEAAHGYRNRSIPVDNIVQDWHYWGNLGWGPHWDPAFYPNPADMVQELNSMNMQLMVSVWSKFDKNTIFFKEMEANGQMLGSSVYYDAWNPMARTQFYEYSKQSMFDIGVTCLWLDATEPENFPNENTQAYLGTGNALFNSYSLMTTKAISDGLREDFSEEQGARVFQLTRSSFAGQQKNGACLWSGDISGKWDSLRRQIAASLNYQLSGIPYWSEDIGGFFRPDDQYTSPDYHNLLVRWFQFGSFTPIYRVHGGGSRTEIWNYGPDVEAHLNATSNLRYRLIPYIYSGFYRVEVEGYTMQRAMVFKFPDDAIARKIGDQFFWGDALMVCPVYTNSTERDIYFPEPMTDFWSGKEVTKGPAQGVNAPLNQIPLYAPHGAILPMGPHMQWTGEKAADPIEIRVFPGADGSFTLFEDDGKSLDYRTGGAATIEFSYVESEKTLTIGARKGSFPEMLEHRTFNVVFVSPDHGAGADPTPDSAIDQKVAYSGAEVKVKM